MIKAKRPIFTPDGRYIVVRGRLWRSSNPNLAPAGRQRLVEQLMDARRAVRSASQSGETDNLRAARAKVQITKEALGERGAVWWSDEAPDLNRTLVINTPYAEWWTSYVSEEQE
jgi:hypothetical protein